MCIHHIFIHFRTEMSFYIGSLEIEMIGLCVKKEEKYVQKKLWKEKKKNREKKKKKTKKKWRK